MTRQISILLLLLFPVVSMGQTSLNIVPLANWKQDTLVTNSTQVRYNDCWGYVQNNIEYAIAGSTEGTHFFQINDDNSFVHLDFVEGKYNSSMVVHRDVKTFQNYAYAVCDEGESSLQIIDLSYLPDSVHLVTDNDSIFGRVHNVFIDEDNALLYACSVTPFFNGMLQPMLSMQVFSLSDPTNPVLLYTGPNDIPEVHDIYVRNNIAYLNCGFDGLRVYNFSNPASPQFLHNLSFYQEQGYNHQGWMTPDGSRYVFGDETNGKNLKLCSIESDHEPKITQRFGTNAENGSVPHNIMLSNEFAYVAYYNEGLRIYDIRSSNPTEVAHYDTYPDDSPFKMNGAWGVYSELPSGRILVSDRQYGLFLFDFREDIFSLSDSETITVLPNPVASEESLIIKLEDPEINEFSIRIIDYWGQPVHTSDYNSQSYAVINMNMAQGIYFVEVSYLDYLGEQKFERRKVIVY